MKLLYYIYIQIQYNFKYIINYYQNIDEMFQIFKGKSNQKLLKAYQEYKLKLEAKQDRFKEFNYFICQCRDQVIVSQDLKENRLVFLDTLEKLMENVVNEIFFVKFDQLSNYLTVLEYLLNFGVISVFEKNDDIFKQIINFIDIIEFNKGSSELKILWIKVVVKISENLKLRLIFINQNGFAKLMQQLQVKDVALQKIITRAMVFFLNEQDFQENKTQQKQYSNVVKVFFRKVKQIQFFQELFQEEEKSEVVASESLPSYQELFEFSLKLQIQVYVFDTINQQDIIFSNSNSIIEETSISIPEESHSQEIPNFNDKSLIKQQQNILLKDGIKVMLQTLINENTQVQMEILTTIQKLVTDDKSFQQEFKNNNGYLEIQNLFKEDQQFNDFLLQWIQQIIIQDYDRAIIIDYDAMKLLINLCTHNQYEVTTKSLNNLKVMLELNWANILIVEKLQLNYSLAQIILSIFTNEQEGFTKINEINLYYSETTFSNLQKTNLLEQIHEIIFNNAKNLRNQNFEFEFILTEIILTYHNDISKNSLISYCFDSLWQLIDFKLIHKCIKFSCIQQKIPNLLNNIKRIFSLLSFKIINNSIQTNISLELCITYLDKLFTYIYQILQCTHQNEEDKSSSISDIEKSTNICKIVQNFIINKISVLNMPDFCFFLMKFHEKNSEINLHYKLFNILTYIYNNNQYITNIYCLPYIFKVFNNNPLSFEVLENYINITNKDISDIIQISLVNQDFSDDSFKVIEKLPVYDENIMLIILNSLQNGKISHKDNSLYMSTLNVIQNKLLYSKNERDLELILNNILDYEKYTEFSVNYIPDILSEIAIISLLNTSQNEFLLTYIYDKNYILQLLTIIQKNINVQLKHQIILYSICFQLVSRKNKKIKKIPLLSYINQFFSQNKNQNNDKQDQIQLCQSLYEMIFLNLKTENNMFINCNFSVFFPKQSSFVQSLINKSDVSQQIISNQNKQQNFFQNVEIIEIFINYMSYYMNDQNCIYETLKLFSIQLEVLENVNLLFDQKISIYILLLKLVNEDNQTMVFEIMNKVLIQDMKLDKKEFFKQSQCIEDGQIFRNLENFIQYFLQELIQKPIIQGENKFKINFIKNYNEILKKYIKFSIQTQVLLLKSINTILQQNKEEIISILKDSQAIKQKDQLVVNLIKMQVKNNLSEQQLYLVLNGVSYNNISNYLDDQLIYSLVYIMLSVQCHDLLQIVDKLLKEISRNKRNKNETIRQACNDSKISQFILKQEEKDKNKWFSCGVQSPLQKVDRDDSEDNEEEEIYDIQSLLNYLSENRDKLIEQMILKQFTQRKHSMEKKFLQQYNLQLEKNIQGIKELFEKQIPEVNSEKYFKELNDILQNKYIQGKEYVENLLNQVEMEKFNDNINNSFNKSQQSCFQSSTIEIKNPLQF